MKKLVVVPSHINQGKKDSDREKFYYGFSASPTTDITYQEHVKSMYALNDLESMQLGNTNIVPNAYQIFFSKTSFSSQEEVSKIKIDLKFAKKFADSKNIKLFVHAPFSINFARNPNNIKNVWIQDLLLDNLKLGKLIGALGCVIHMGKTNTSDGKIDLEEAFLNMKKSIENVLDNLGPDQKGSTLNNSWPKLLLETAAGKGSEMCHSLEDFARLWKSIDPKYHSKLGLCIDTCHIFSAGYDIRTEETAKAYLNKFDELIGLKNVSLIHFNDSKDNLNSKTDRHEMIGLGKIGSKLHGGSLEGFSYIVKTARDKGIPVVLETGSPLEPQLAIIHEMAIIQST